MPKVVGVRFHGVGKIYHFSPGDLVLQSGDAVIVDTSQGQELGIVAQFAGDIIDENLVAPLKPVIRIATAEDIEIYNENLELERVAFKNCRERIKALGLEMNLVEVECSFDHAKLVFYFTADGRIDFRDLVRDLAQIFRMRIELRQIGVRDEARMVGGLGICGRTLCCANFLHDFIPVSIKMAKEQSLSMNPGKISGACGRLLCCLKYEQEAYEYSHKLLPKVGTTADLPQGKFKVEDVNLLKEKVFMRSVTDPDEVLEMGGVEFAQLTGRELPATTSCCSAKGHEGGCCGGKCHADSVDETAESVNIMDLAKNPVDLTVDVEDKQGDSKAKCNCECPAKTVNNAVTPATMRGKELDQRFNNQDVPEWLDAEIVMEEVEPKNINDSRGKKEKPSRKRQPRERNKKNTANAGNDGKRNSAEEQADSTPDLSKKHHYKRRNNSRKNYKNRRSGNKNTNENNIEK